MSKIDTLIAMIGIVLLTAGIIFLAYVIVSIYKSSTEEPLPIECHNGQAYEITYHGNVKFYDEIVGTTCEDRK
jgi:hypothetical protein